MVKDKSIALSTIIVDWQLFHRDDMITLHRDLIKKIYFHSEYIINSLFHTTSLCFLYMKSEQEMGDVDTPIAIRTFLVCFGGISGKFSQATVQAKIPMARASEPNMLLKHTCPRKVHLVFTVPKFCHKSSHVR